jgi:hypothetical protein
MGWFLSAASRDFHPISGKLASKARGAENPTKKGLKRMLGQVKNFRPVPVNDTAKSTTLDEREKFLRIFQRIRFLKRAAKPLFVRLS